MSLASPSTQSVQAFIFGLDGDSEIHQRAVLSDRVDEDDYLEVDEKRQSMYVELFDEMLIAILNYESHLLHPSEIDFIDRFSLLPYSAKYLLIRLCLRKPGKWHRLSSLKYQHELGENITTAIQLLCVCPKQCFPEKHVLKQEKPEIIDLTLDEMEITKPPPALFSERPKTESGPSSVKIEGISEHPCGDLSFFAQDESNAELHELLDCLSMDELKQLAKDMKIGKASLNRAAIESLLIKHASSQSILPSVGPRAKVAKLPVKQRRLPFIRKSQCDHLRQMTMKVLGTCIRVNDSVFALLRRLNLVYFRCTHYTPDILTPSILSRARKRAFQPYDCIRSSDIWPTRAALLAYERALELEAQVDALHNGTARARSRSRSVTSHLTHELPPKSESGATAEICLEGDVVEESQRARDARAVLAIFELAYAEWKELGEGHCDPRPGGLERFDRGHVLTRIVQKGAEALGILKYHGRELEVLETLLSQRRWRRGRRGKWYERRALVLTRYCGKSSENLRRAMRGLLDALNDRDTHIVYRPSLSRRLTALEKKMGISPEERHQDDPLSVAEDVSITGIRLRSILAVPEPPLDTPAEGKQRVLPFSVVKPTFKTRQVTAPAAGVLGDVQKGKSMWKGQGDEVVNVETYALQHYERLGYKGYHCEGRIVTTLFGLLFWDIVFAPIPGAFETPYQMAPLDIFEDTFYHARQGPIETRLDQICEGNARNIIQTVDEEHRERGTWCLGVRWDQFPREDLLEIAECFRGEALACLCRVLCEDYAQRGSGVPDLFIWNYAEKQCKFVEVKGPGDKLQENQKLWIDVMQRAEVSVEVCHVAELGTKRQITGNGKKKSRAARRKPKPVDREAETVISVWEEEDELDASQYLQESDLDVTLAKKRSADETLPREPVAKRLAIG
ncbi:VRR-NUC domain-containing protein [Russula earlei]|uniref:VRR-NUC domain-containing protein n=1 Tax=Russula earlei TaxID=71964 RepID=A0ACC0U4C6_9AGAM|nr:VRR-NUC domain-containing protein [Russula earlei]